MYKLKNYMEDIVMHKIDGLLSYMKLCNCEKCKMDIMALALNDLPAKYVVTDKGELFTKLKELESQFDIDVEAAIIKAAIFVSKNPKH